MNMTSLDLFAGAGGFSLGLKMGGVQSVGAIEADQNAVTTFRRNFPDVEAHCRAIETCSDRWFEQSYRGVDIVVGGPPCQGFSVAGALQYGRIDRRNSLVLEMARAVVATRPRIVIMENVRGIINGRLADGESVLKQYVAQLDEIGFSTRVFLLQACAFGVPQIRQRVFVVSAQRGTRLPIDIVPIALEPVTTDDALGDLPPLRSGEGVEHLVPYAQQASTAYQKAMREGSTGVINHVAMRHTPRILERLESLGHGDSLQSVAHLHGQRRRNSSEIVSDAVFKMNCTRIAPDRPAITLPANFQTIHVHPHQHRMITAREGARLQSYPDHFVFCGPRTSMSRKLLEREGRLDELGLSQYNQIGNSVPPLLARAVVEALVYGHGAVYDASARPTKTVGKPSTAGQLRFAF